MPTQPCAQCKRVQKGLTDCKDRPPFQVTEIPLGLNPFAKSVLWFCGWIFSSPRCPLCLRLECINFTPPPLLDKVYRSPDGVVPGAVMCLVPYGALAADWSHRNHPKIRRKSVSTRSNKSNTRRIKHVLTLISIDKMINPVPKIIMK